MLGCRGEGTDGVWFVEYDALPSPPCSVSSAHPTPISCRIAAEMDCGRARRCADGDLGLVSAEDAGLDGLLSWWLGMMELEDRLGFERRRILILEP